MAMINKTNIENLNITNKSSFISLKDKHLNMDTLEK